MKPLLILTLLALQSTGIAAPVEKLGNFELTDQDARPRPYIFPKEKVSVITVADHKGSDQLPPWVEKLFKRYQKSIDIDGIADVSMIPKPFHSFFRKSFKKQLTYSIMLDWKGNVINQFAFDKGLANLYVVQRDGTILKKISGPYSEEGFKKLTDEIDRAIKRSPNR